MPRAVLRIGEETFRFLWLFSTSLLVFCMSIVCHGPRVHGPKTRDAHFEKCPGRWLGDARSTSLSDPSWQAGKNQVFKGQCSELEFSIENRSFHR